MNVLKALKRSPLGLDLYTWLSYRTFSLNRPLPLSWKKVYRQFGADPPGWTTTARSKISARTACASS